MIAGGIGDDPRLALFGSEGRNGIAGPAELEGPASRQVFSDRILACVIFRVARLGASIVPVVAEYPHDLAADVLG